MARAPKRGIANVGNTCYLSAGVQIFRPLAEWLESKKGSNQVAGAISGVLSAVDRPAQEESIRNLLALLNMEVGHQHDAIEFVRALTFALPAADSPFALRRALLRHCPRCGTRHDSVSPDEFCVQVFAPTELARRLHCARQALGDAAFGSVALRLSCHDADQEESARAAAWTTCANTELARDARVCATGLPPAPTGTPALKEALAISLFTEARMTASRAEPCACKAPVEPQGSWLRGDALPSVLVVDLMSELHSSPIELPFELDVRQICKPPAAEGTCYQLCSFLVHTGSDGRGHYVAYVLGCDDAEQAEPRWTLYDDGSVQDVGVAAVEQQLQGARALFYQIVVPAVPVS